MGLGQTQAVEVHPTRRLILEPDEVPHGLEAAHPDVAVLPALVSGGGPPVLSAQKVELHLNEICRRKLAPDIIIHFYSPS